MTRVTIPWTLQASEPQLLKQQREELQLQEILKKTKENLPVSVARIVGFLNKNKNQTYTNKQIASEVKLSGSVVAGIMDKLEEIGFVKVVKIRRSLKAGISQVYQSAEGSLGKVEKEREAEGCISKVLKLFNENVNAIYTKKEIASITNIPKDRVGQALSILIVTGKIKVVGAIENTFTFQHADGKNLKRRVSFESDKSFITLGNYLKMNGIKGNVEAALSVDYSRLFYSDKGIVTEYEISYLQKVIGLGNKKKSKQNIFSKMLTW